MDLKKYVYILQKRMDMVLASFLVITFVIIFVTFVQRPVYEASVKLLIESKIGASSLLSNLSAGSDLSALSHTSSPLNTQMEIIRTEPIMRQVIETLGLKDKKGFPLKASALKRRISVSALGLTDIVLISAQSGDPMQASNIANSIADVFVKESQDVNQREAGAARQFIEKQIKDLELELSGVDMGGEKGVNILQNKRLASVAEKTYLMLLEKLEEARIAEAIRVGYARIIEPANVPRSPVRPRRVFNIFFGAIFGMFFGVMLAFVYEYFDDSIKNEEDVKELLGLPVLGVIPHFDEQNKTSRHGSHAGLNRFIPAKPREYYKALVKKLRAALEGKK